MEFHICIENRVAEVLSDGGALPLLVCDNTDNRITFSFDSEWSEYSSKTARFVYRESFGQGDLVYVDVAFTGNTVAVPVLHNVKEVWIGVSAGNLVTTSAARISVLSSIYAFSAVSAENSSDERIELEMKTVMPDFESGDDVILPSAGKVLSAVVIKKPTALIPENIRSGVEIAGVVGTYCADPVVTVAAPSIRLNGDVLTITPGPGNLPESYDLYANGEHLCVTAQATVNLRTMLQGFDPGDYSIWAVSCIDSVGVKSEGSNRVGYTLVAEEFSAPIISLKENILTITPTSTAAESYEIYAGGEVAHQTVNTEVNLSSVLGYLEAGTYDIFVIAWKGNGSEQSDISNTVQYTIP